MMSATLAGLAFGVAGTAAAHAIPVPGGRPDPHRPTGRVWACLMPLCHGLEHARDRPAAGRDGGAMDLPGGADVVPAIAISSRGSAFPQPLTISALPRHGWIGWRSSPAGLPALVQNNPRPAGRCPTCAVSWGPPSPATAPPCPLT